MQRVRGLKSGCFRARNHAGKDKGKAFPCTERRILEMRSHPILVMPVVIIVVPVVMAWRVITVRMIFPVFSMTIFNAAIITAAIVLVFMDFAAGSDKQAEESE